jgi:hypothetical protein
MIYICTQKAKEQKLHTVINKIKIEDTTFICAIGYGGGGVYEEFCGSFKWDDEEEALVGNFSRYHNPDEWELKSIETEIEDDVIIKIPKKEKEIIFQLASEIWDNYIYFDETSEQMFLKPGLEKKLKDGETYISDDWDVDVVDFVSNNLWGLTLRFDW